MWAIWAKQLLPQALKSCLKCNKLSNLVTLHLKNYRNTTDCDAVDIVQVAKWSAGLLFISTIWVHTLGSVL